MRSMPSYAKDAIFAVAPDSEADAMDLKDIVAQAKVSRQTAQRALNWSSRDALPDRQRQEGRRFPAFPTGESFLFNF
jgi:hypothetical protein